MVLFSWLLYKSPGTVFCKEFPSFVVKKYSDVIREPAYFPSTLPLRETSVVVRGIVDKNYDGLSSQPHVNIKGPGRQALWMKVEHQKKDKG